MIGASSLRNAHFLGIFIYSYAIVAGIILPALGYTGYVPWRLEYLLTALILVVPAVLIAAAIRSSRWVGGSVVALLVAVYGHVYCPALIPGVGAFLGVVVIVLAAFELAGRALLSAFAVAAVAGLGSAAVVSLPTDKVLWSKASPERSSAPAVLHILIDEMASDWGLPEEIIPPEERARLWQPFIDRGFALFDRSFSRSSNTPPSLAAFLNPRHEAVQSILHPVLEEFQIRSSTVFQKIAKTRDIFALSTSYADVTPALADLPQAVHAERWKMNVPDVYDLGIPAEDRMMMALAAVFAWAADSQDAPFFKWLYHESSLKAPLHEMFFSRSHPQFGVSMKMLGRLEGELKANGQRGRYYFAHVLLPHFPYAYDRNCALRPSDGWLARMDTAGHDTREGRVLRYNLYLDQALCLQSRLLSVIDGVLANPELADTVIILHGDHGSRIGSLGPEEWSRLGTREEYEHDWRASFLGVRVPGVSGRHVHKVTDAVEAYGQMVESDFALGDFLRLASEEEAEVPTKALIRAPVGRYSGLVGEGWHDAILTPKRWTGASAEAELRVPREKGLRQLFLNVGAGAVPTTLTVTVNGQVMASRDLLRHEDASLFMEIPDRLAGTVARIGIAVSQTWRPSDYGSPEDHRDLGVEVSELSFIAVDPPSVARLDLPLNGSGGLIGSGWSLPDAEATRWTGGEAEARLKVPTTGNQPVLSLTASAGRVPTIMRVWFDGRPIAAQPMEKGQRVTLHLPLPREVVGRVGRIRVTSDATWSPADFGDPKDGRVLGVRVHSLGAFGVDVPSDARLDAPLDGRGGAIGPGWFDVDREGTRWTGESGDALLAVPAHGGVPMLKVKAAAGRVPTTLHLWVNDHPVESVPLAVGQTASLALPLPDRLAGTVARVRLTTDPTWTPADFGTVGDRRKLGVRVHALSIAAVKLPAGARMEAPIDGASGLIGRGWFDVDREATRWTGAEAEALLLVPADKTSKALTLFLAAGRVATPLTVEIDGQLADTVELLPGQDRVLRYPLPAGTAGKPVRIKLVVGKTWSPATFGTPGDARALGVRVRSIQVVAAPPTRRADLGGPTMAGLIGAGWYGAGKDGSRWTGRQADAVLASPEARTRLSLTLSAGPVATTATVTVAGKTIEAISLAPYQKVSKTWSVPTVSNRDMAVRITCDRTWNPDSSGTPGDLRELGVRVSQLELVADAP